MAFNRSIAAALSVLWLAGCAGGANLYGEPAAQFETAVDTTAALTRDYTVLEQRMRDAAQTSALAKDRTAVLKFSSGACKASGSTCAIVNSSSGEQLGKVKAKGDDAASSPVLDLMAKMQVYAATLSSIAQANTAQELEAVGTSVQKAYTDLHNGVRSHDMAAVKDITLKPSDAAVEVAASIYLERQRIKMLLALVEQGDPVVAAVSDTLGSMVGEMQTSYVQTQSDTVQNLILNYNVLGGQAGQAGQAGSALAKREVEAMRRDLLSRALSAQNTLNGVSQVDAKAAFARMKNAHAKLLAALKLAATPKGVSEAALATMSQAIGEFTDAAMQAVESMNAVKEWY